MHPKVHSEPFSKLKMFFGTLFYSSAGNVNCRAASKKYTVRIS